MKPLQVSKNNTKVGTAPALLLTNPKYARNVASVVRAASCYGIKQVFYTGDRVRQDVEERGRLPREERMKGYGEVDLFNTDYPFDCFTDVTPVGVELLPNAELLPNFEHPENPLYVFGPEDGSVSKVFRRECHRFVVAPTRHCMNLAAAVNVVLYDRMVKRITAGLEPEIAAGDFLFEDRGYHVPCEEEDA